MAKNQRIYFSNFALIACDTSAAKFMNEPPPANFLTMRKMFCGRDTWHDRRRSFLSHVCHPAGSATGCHVVAHPTMSWSQCCPTRVRYCYQQRPKNNNNCQHRISVIVKSSVFEKSLLCVPFSIRFWEKVLLKLRFGLIIVKLVTFASSCKLTVIRLLLALYQKSRIIVFKKKSNNR